jgi:hypothetical protein
VHGLCRRLGQPEQRQPGGKEEQTRQEQDRSSHGHPFGWG